MYTLNENEKDPLANIKQKTNKRRHQHNYTNVFIPNSLRFSFYVLAKKLFKKKQIFNKNFNLQLFNYFLFSFSKNKNENILSL